MKDVYYQEGFPDPVFDKEYVLRLVRPFAPGAGDVTGVDETGGEARTYAIDGDIILKVQRPHRLRLRTSLAKEAFFLKELERHGICGVPRLLGYGKEGTVEYNCITRVPGVPVRNAHLDDKQREKMLIELGRTLYAIHNVDIKPFYESGLFLDTDKSDEDVRRRVKHYFTGTLDRISRNPELTQSDIDAAANKADSLIAKITDVRVKPRHADPSSEHTFVEKSEFSGVIDFGDSYITHPALDLRRWPQGEREILLEAYINAGKTEPSFKAVCEAVFGVEKILEDLRDKSRRV